MGDEKVRDMTLTGMVTGVSDELFWCWLDGDGLDDLNSHTPACTHSFASLCKLLLSEPTVLLADITTPDPGVNTSQPNGVAGTAPQRVRMCTYCGRVCHSSAWCAYWARMCTVSAVSEGLS